jgi:hypothetical protein
MLRVCESVLAKAHILLWRLLVPDVLGCVCSDVVRSVHGDLLVRHHDCRCRLEPLRYQLVSSTVNISN